MLQRAETPVALTGVEASQTFFASCFAGRASDDLWVAHVDEEARCIHLASYAADDSGDLPVRAILGDAIRYDSAGLLLAHHRHGCEAAPSQADRAETQALATAAEAIDVTLVDHLIFHDDTFASFRRLGLL